MDLIGPLKVTSQGNYTIFTVTCYLTRTAAARPLKGKASVDVAKALVSIFFQYVYKAFDLIFLQIDYLIVLFLSLQIILNG